MITPTVRRRQRLSSSCTVPADFSAGISTRAMSLRISTGRLSSASVSRSPSLKAKRASPSGRPLRSSARTSPCSVPAVVARSTLTVRAPAALSAATSACAVGSPPATTLTGRPSAALARPSTNSEPRPMSTPSDSQTISMLGVAVSRRAIAGNASTRSMACGLGLIRLSRTRAAAGVCSEMSRPASPSGISTMPRLSVSARAIRSSAVRMRASQLAAAVMPSSIRSAIGIAPLVVAAGGFHSGPAAARITSVARVRRSSVSHHGVREGVSSFGLMSNSSRVGGNSMRVGLGGISRSSHHSTGRLSRPSSTSGLAKPSGRPIMRTSSSVSRRRATAPRRRCPRRCAHEVRAGVRWRSGRCGG